MEGHGIKDTPEYKTDKRKVGKLPLMVMLIIGFIIGLFIGIIISPYILEMFDEEETPIYQQYTRISGTDMVVFRNEELSVKITHMPLNDHPYDAEWTDNQDRLRNIGWYTTKDALFNGLLEHSEYMTINQFNWFEYMLKNVVE